MKRNFLFIGIICLMAIITGCTKETKASITLNNVSDANLTCPVAGAEAKVSFNSACDWTVGTTATWISITPASGVANEAASITIKVAANDAFDSRTDKVTLVSKDVTLDITVTQGQVNSIEVEGEYFYVNGQGGEITIPIKTNIDYQVVIPDEATWLTVGDTKGIEQKNAVLTAAFNAEYIYREAEVIIRAEGVDNTVTVAQGSSIVSLDMKDYIAQSASNLVSIAYTAEGSLLVCPGDGNPIAIVDGETGEKTGTLDLGDIKPGFIENDDAGNILICNHTAYLPDQYIMDAPFTVWKYKDGAATKIIEYAEAYQPLGSKLAIRGNVNGDALVVSLYEGIADITLSNSMVYWTIKGGQVSEPVVADVTGIIGLVSWGCEGYWNIAPNNAPAIVPVSANPADGFLLTMYDDNNIYFIDGTTYAATIMMRPRGGEDSNYAYNALETRTASNGHTFMALGCQPFWPQWSCTPVLMVFDITDIPAIIAENPTADEASALVMYPSTYSFLDPETEEGVNACGDVMLAEIDGFLMAFYADHNNHTIEGFAAPLK